MSSTRAAVRAGRSHNVSRGLARDERKRALLFEVDAHDPSIFAATVGVLLAVAIASSWLPARRAMRVEPGRALRSE
jgi:hypothetical protein